MLGEEEVLPGEPDPPEPGSQEQELLRGPAPPRVGDSGPVRSADRPVLGLRLDAPRRAHRRTHSTMAPAGWRSAPAGIRMRASAAACARMSWLPAVRRGKTPSTPPSSEILASR